MSDFEDDVLNSDGDLDYEVCEEDEEALLADDQASRTSSQVVDARERIIMQRQQSKGPEDEWEDDEEAEDTDEGRGRFISERAPNPQTAPPRPRELIPDSLEQVQVPETATENRRQNNFVPRGRGGRRGGRFFNRGNFRGRGGIGRYNNGHMRNMNDNGMRFQEQQQPLLQTPVSGPTKILINPHFKGPRPLLSTTPKYPEPEEPFRQPNHYAPPPPMNNQPPPGPPGPSFQQQQQFNPPLLPPAQSYHEHPRQYVDQPPPYNAPPPHRQPPPQDWGPPEPFYHEFPQRQPPQQPPHLLPPRPPPPQQFGVPPPRGPMFHEPPHRHPLPPPPPQQHFAPYQQPPPYSQPPPHQQFQPPPMNYPPPPQGQPSYMQPPPMSHPAPYYDPHTGGAQPANMYSAPPPLHQPAPLLSEDLRASIFLSERLERRRRSRSRSPYDRYSSRRSRSRSYSPPRRYRDDIRRDRPRRLSPEPIRKHPRPMSPGLVRRKETSPPPRKPVNPEESAYLRAIEKQKQERETVLKMKAIKRKLEAEKKKREGDKQESPEKKEPTSPTTVSAGPSKEPILSPKKPLLSTVILKPKMKVIKKEEPLRKVSLISSGGVDQPLVSKALTKNGSEQPIRRILSTKKELASFNLESVASVSSVLRGAEGPTQNNILKKPVVISKLASHAGLSNSSVQRISLVSNNKQMQLATSKSVAAVGVTVAVDNISSATKPETLKKMGVGMGLKKIIMKQAGSQQKAHMVFGNKEGAEKFVKMNQRKVLDLSVIDLKLL